MSIWTEIRADRIKPDDFICCIEIPKGCKNKYEVDKETGLLILDRILYTSTHYPANYGFIPRTYAEDDDPLDVLVLCSEAVSSMSLVRCFPIGMISMIDEGQEDIKIVAVPFRDPTWNGYADIFELPHHIMEEIKHFFGVYKQLEGKTMTVLEIFNREKAQAAVRRSIEAFNRKFNL